MNRRERTKESRMMSASWPWNESTVATVTLVMDPACSPFETSPTCPLYGDNTVMRPAAMPRASSNATTRSTAPASLRLHRDREPGSGRSALSLASMYTVGNEGWKMTRPAVESLSQRSRLYCFPGMPSGYSDEIPAP